jgi:hypothetical protein
VCSLLKPLFPLHGHTSHSNIYDFQTNRKYYSKNYDELKLLNPNFPLLMRTVENAMPAIATELEWTIQDLLRFMIQTGRFRDPNGTLSESRIEAAKAYLQTDWNQLQIERFKSPGFDPERPYVDEDFPEWKGDAKITKDLATYASLKSNMDEQMEVIKSGPNDEFTRAENALLMCQRVDLWCAGEKEVERAVQHLYKLGRKLNEREVIYPAFIAEFMPGVDDMEA